MALNTLHFSNVLVTNLVYGLSDHAAKLLTINEINLENKHATLKQFGI
jgi:hypothetical protein